MPLASLRGVGVTFGSRRALDGVDLDVVEGERVAVIGPSGAGKTTLLRVLNGSVAAAEGSARLFGVDPAGLAPARRRAVQQRVGTVYQQLHLVESLRVIHNVNAGHLGRWSLARALGSLLRPAGVEVALAALDRVGLADRAFDRTDRLSGGQQQRVALARVLVQDPDLILADEPVSALDPTKAEEVVRLLCGLAEEGGKALVVSVHRLDLALGHFDRVVGLRQGRVAFDLAARAVPPEVLRDLFRSEAVPG